MTVKELIEYLQTLNQEAEVVAGDSEYPDVAIEKTSFEYYVCENTYRIY